jgi:hypothetical protein
VALSRTSAAGSKERHVAASADGRVVEDANLANDDDDDENVDDDDERPVRRFAGNDPTDERVEPVENADTRIDDECRRGLTLVWESNTANIIMVGANVIMVAGR